MWANDELSKTFSQAQQSPSRFFDFFKVRPLFYQFNDFDLIKRACWFESCMGSAFWGMWIDPGARHTEPKANLMFADFMINEAFKSGINTLAGLIQQRPSHIETIKFIWMHERGWGFEYCGCVPYFFDGKDCHIVALTAERWRRWVEEQAEKPSFRRRLQALSSS